MDPNVEPWIYPLFYPFGTRGWHKNISYVHKQNKKVTRNDYHKYRIAIRNEFNVFLMGRRLFQQWVVDSYVKTEKDRLNYLRNNQKQLRAESYQGLIDHLNKCRNSENNDNTTNIGKMIILPSSFSGSPRNMLQHYQDSMAIVRKFGKPDIFVTMTCNPNWLEIKENLFSKQTAADRPDIVTRVFNIKKNALIDMIVKERHFGEVLAYVYVIEFQKRGLPHMHMLITLAEKYKITTPQMVDKYICAEIPNESDDPILYDIITKNMLHGPCGNWCIVNGKCSKHYPKKFQQETTMDENCYPYYRRRDLGIIFTRSQGSHFTNEHVVPYNRILSKRFNSHINVEIISSIKSVKYLYKYVYKGHDEALITINGNVSNSDNNATIQYDEIYNHIETRYVGPAEAVWRILSKPLQEKSHSIIRLPIHLPNQQNLLINNDCDEAEIRNVLEKQTMLIDFFALNARDQNARKYIYTDIPYHYVFKKENRSNTFHWVQRQKQFKVISRMYSVSPSQVELFHLRLLLTKVKGPKSYEDIRTVNGHTYDTYMNTCLALGLIEDDNEWERALGEAESWMMPYQLRYLFVRILLHCYPMYPDKLWEKFKKSMSEDYTINLGSILGEKKAYFHINSILCDEGSHISNFPNMPQMTDWEYVDDNGTIQENNHRGAQQYQTLNEQQKEISKNRNICTMAYTGIAATLLPNGKTLHKTFNLPVPLFSDSSSNIKYNSKQGEYLKNIDVFIWDEAPMAPKYALEVIDRTLRDMMNSEVPFGGKVMILGGDFRQLLPVKKNSTRTELVSLSIKYSYLWQYFHQFTLTQNMRTLPSEVEFSKFLLNVGDGTLNDNNDNLTLPNQSRNVDVNRINNETVQLLDYDTEKVFTSIDSTENCDNGDIDDVILPEYLNTLNPPNFPFHELILRKFCIVMLLRNLNISEGLCNGTRLMILELGNNILKCKILNGDKSGEIAFISRITLYCEDIYPFTFKRRQFPIVLAFAITINKAQGQTFDMIGIDLTKDIFNHGQLYVAFSRVRSWETLH
ncbi:uncharacterized protein, partial [Chelonus insularis]|uniref:uncharacterized protein n=1 Tax=Chelonus insularis TaxID=460826 RepID=UPI00158AC119